MKNLNPYNGDCYEIHKKAVNAKDNSAVRTSLLNLNDEILESFKLYQANFTANRLEDLEANTNYTKFKEQLLSLYGYQTGTIRELREEILKVQGRCIQYTCQNCGLETASTLDHLVPKEEFPEYVINAYNLIPSCGKCNGHKSSVWRKHGKRLFLNLYTDKLPSTQYLFVEIFTDKNGEIDFRFFLDNKNDLIDVELFDLIHTHFTRLQLFERLRMKSIGLLTELQNSISNRLVHLDLDTILDEVIKTAEKNKESYGTNYFKSVLEIGLAQSKIFRGLFTIL